MFGAVKTARAPCLEGLGGRTVLFGADATTSALFCVGLGGQTSLFGAIAQLELPTHHAMPVK